MATVGFSAAGIANEPVSWLRKLCAIAVPFHVEIDRARSEADRGRDDAALFEVRASRTRSNPQRRQLTATGKRAV